MNTILPTTRDTEHQNHRAPTPPDTTSSTGPSAEGGPPSSEAKLLALWLQRIPRMWGLCCPLLVVLGFCDGVSPQEGCSANGKTGRTRASDFVPFGEAYLVTGR
jgi:hypothetical protein